MSDWFSFCEEERNRVGYCYIARKDTWFDAYTEAVRLIPMYTGMDGRRWALFVGHKNNRLDEEICCLDEFY